MATIQSFMLPRERAKQKLRDGTPLLHDEPVRLDLDLVIDRLLALDPRLSDAVERGRLDLERLLNEAFVQHTDHVTQLASAAGLDARPLSGLASQAVAPVLRAYAQRLQPLVDATWTRGYCPICGSLPLDARCAACGATWP